MIPELQRMVPPEILAPALRNWTKIWPPRCIRKYGKPDSDDIVVDVGAMYGEFTIPASKYAKQVYALEPANAWPRLTRAISSYDNIRAYRYAAGESDKLIGFDFSPDPSESMRDPIHDSMVKMRRLDSLNFIEDVTFLKIDAEGYEPEVLDGLGDYRPTRISVDVSEKPQRNPRDKCYVWLHSRGYEIRDTGPVLKAVMP